jgi:hypothetical protein
MKKIIIGIAMAACFAMGFSTGGFKTYGSSDLMPNITVEKAFISESIPNSMALDNPSAQDASIFSWTTIFYLSVAVIGIVAFRRNTCI